MTITKIIGLVVVLLLAALAGFFIIRKSEKHSLIKWILVFIFVSIAFTWIFEYGYFNGATYYDYGMNKLGLSDIPNIIYYGISFASDKIIYLLALGCFYAVLSKVEGYKKLVTRLAEIFKGKEIIFILCSSLLITAMVSIFSQTFAALTFVPFIISVLLSMNLDRLTAFSTTFGSILIGTLGLTYGGEGLYYFNYYTGLVATTGIIYRLIVVVVSFILFNLFNIIHAKKVLDSNVNEKDIDPFVVEKPTKDVRTWPVIVLFILLFIILILGYVAWESSFGIKVFSKFHTWLIGLKLGDIWLLKYLFNLIGIGEYLVFKPILGTLAAAFGAWNLFHASILLIVFALIFALIGRVKFNDVISSFGEGASKFGKSIVLFVGVYVVMIAAYMSPFMPTIVDLVFNGISKFNPFLVSLFAFISNIFHTDLGYTGYVVGTYFINSYAANTTLIHLIFTTMYGFVQLFVPTSAILLIGLAYLNIDYKTWMKYIWIFVVSILIILLVLFAVIAYI